MTYKGVLLDFYGTVVEEDGPAINSIVRTIVRDHPEQSRSELAQLWGEAFSSLLTTSYGSSFRTQRDLELESLSSVLRHVGSTLDPVELSAPQFAYWRAPKVRPGSAEFLHSCPVPICIVSNIDQADLDSAIEYTGLPKTARVTSEEFRSYKPRPELFEAGLGLLGLDPAEVLHIGDSWGSDVVGANALGIHAIWVTEQRKSVPSGAKILRQCSDLRDIAPLLEQARGA